MCYPYMTYKLSLFISLSLRYHKARPYLRSVDVEESSIS